MVSLGGFKLNRLMGVVVDFTMLNLSTQLVNTINIPPAAKAIVNVSISLGNIAILRKLTKGMPMASLINGLMGVNEALIIVQQIPNLVSAVSSMTNTTGVTTTSTSSF